MGGINKLYRLIRISLMEKTCVRSSLKECVSHAHMWQKNVPDRGLSQGQGPKVEMHISYIDRLRNQELDVTRAGRMVIEDSQGEN